MAGPEKRIESAFCRWCKSVGLRVKKLAAIGQYGFPDRTIFLGRGHIACIEFKSPTGKPDPRQLNNHRELREDGIPLLVTSDLQEAKDFIRKLQCELELTSPPRKSGPRTRTSSRSSSSCTRGQH